MVEETYRQRVTCILDKAIDKGDEFIGFDRDEIIKIKTDYLNAFDKNLKENGKNPKEIITDKYIDDEIIKLTIMDQLTSLTLQLREYVDDDVCDVHLLIAEQTSREMMESLFGLFEQDKDVIEGGKILKEFFENNNNG